MALQDIQQIHKGNTIPEHATILVVDDEKLVLKALEQTLLREGYRVFTAENGKQAVDILKSHSVAVIICDQRMPGMSGIEVFIIALHIQPDAIRIILTGYSDLDTVLQAINIGQVGQFIMKPWEDALLLQTVGSSVEKFRLVKENQKLHQLTLEQHKDLTKTHENLRHELLLGGRIHESLLLGRVPKNVPGFDIDMISLPSKEIDGDFFEFYRPSALILDVVTGDVMGKGIPAALVGTALKSQLMRFAIPFTHVQLYNREGCWEEDLLAPQEIIAHVHDELVSQLIHLEYFASVIYGRFQLQKRTFTFVDCGSTKPIHYRAKEKKAVTLAGYNLPLGAVEQEIYKPVEINYSKGDFFIFYSDGLTEAKSVRKELYGPERLIEIAEKNPDASPAALLNLIKSSVESFAEKNTFEDDLTIIIIKINQIDLIEGTNLTVAKFQADLSQLRAVREFVDRLCSQAPGDSIFISHQLQLAINEAFCNIVKHGYKDRVKGTVLIQGKLEEEGVSLEISDQGSGFNPARIQDPSLAGDQENGYGWYMIREIADHVTYSHKESEQGWNHMHIYKKYAREGKKMQFAHSKQNNILVITPEGESLDAQDAPEFKEKVIDLIQTNALNRVVFDLHQLQFIDSSGLGSLLSVLRVLHSTGGELKLACMNKPVRTMFELVSMHKIFEIFNSTDEAVNSFKR